jgi:hypothetical protein
MSEVMAFMENQSVRNGVIASPYFGLQSRADFQYNVRTMHQTKSGPGYFEMLRRELFSAVIGDVMDTMGYTHQFLPPQLQPLRDDMIVVGRAMPVWKQTMRGVRVQAGSIPHSINRSV